MKIEYFFNEQETEQYKFNTQYSIIGTQNSRENIMYSSLMNKRQISVFNDNINTQKTIVNNNDSDSSLMNKRQNGIKLIQNIQQLTHRKQVNYFFI